MTPLAPPADQAVRHAVDAYIDGRLLPTFEGEASFETRNSTYRVLDGVLYAAPDHGLLGAELVGWLVEFVARAEVSQAWRPGARAILVDTRNDGVKGPHIIVTSATRAFRKERVPSAPSLPAAGSHPAQDGSAMPQRWGQRDPAPAARDLHASLPRHDLPALPPIPAAPRSPSWGLHPIAPPPPAPVQRRPATLPPPPMPVAARGSSVPPPPAGRHLPPTIPPPAMVPMIVKPATLPPPPPPRLLPRALPPPPPVEDDYIARRIAATLGAAVAAADDLDDAAPTARDARHEYARDVRQAFADDIASASALPARDARGRSTSRLSQGASAFGSAGRPPVAPLPPASVPFLLSRSHQRGVPLR